MKTKDKLHYIIFREADKRGLSEPFKFATKTVSEVLSVLALRNKRVRK